MLNLIKNIGYFALFNLIRCLIWLKPFGCFDQDDQLFVSFDLMFNLINSQIDHFNQVRQSKNTHHSNHKPLIKMGMFISQSEQGNQLGQLRKPWIVVVDFNSFANFTFSYYITFWIMTNMKGENEWIFYVLQFACKCFAHLLKFNKILYFLYHYFCLGFSTLV
jgi:hypothetical protein